MTLGKKFLCALTAGGTESAYREQGYNHYTIRELLRPLEQTAVLCGLDYLPPYRLFGSRTALEEGRVTDHIAGWSAVLAGLQSGQFDSHKLADVDSLNSALAAHSGDLG